nr:putative quinol monooxygenase [Desulfuromonas sp. CSMB_57]
MGRRFSVGNKKLVVVAKFRSRAGKEALVEKELAALLTPTRAEAGCLQYDCHHSPGDPGLFMFYEIWSNRAALDEHLQKPYIQSLLAKADDLFAEAPEIHFLEKLA